MAGGWTGLEPSCTGKVREAGGERVAASEAATASVAEEEAEQEFDGEEEEEVEDEDEEGSVMVEVRQLM